MNLQKFYIKVDNDLVWHLFLLFISISMILVVSDTALAVTDNDVVGNTLCRLVKHLNGGIARGIATIAIFSVGVGLFLGKLNWGVAAATAAGVGIIFSSSKLVAFLSGDDANATCDTGDTGDNK